MRHLLIGLIAFGFIAPSASHAQPDTSGDWPQWRGPQRNGISTETGLLKEWPKGGPKLLWDTKKIGDGKSVGTGIASLAIVQGKIYTIGDELANEKDGDEKPEKGKKKGAAKGDESVFCLDAETGKQIWKTRIAPYFSHNNGSGGRSMPTVEGNRLYVISPQGTLVCMTADTGSVLWQKDLVEEFGGRMMSGWGYSESPTIDGEKVIVTPGGKKAAVVALDKATGAVKWRTTELTDAAPYSTGVMAEINGARQFIQNSSVTGNKGGTLSGVDAKTGKLLWSQPTFKQSSYAIAPSPVVDGNKVYITTGYGGGSHLFEISKDQKAKDLFPKAAQKKIKNTHGGVVRIGGHIYGHTEPGAWFCQDLATGKDKWLERDAFQTQSGSVTSADGLLYLLTDAGEVGLAKASPKEFDLVSSFKLPDASKFPADRKTSKDAKVWAHPVIADGVLYLRDSELLFAYDIRKK